MRDSVVDLAGPWKYFMDKAMVGDKSEFWQPLLDDSTWTSMPVPSNWYLGAGLDHAGKVWFRRSFQLPKLHGKEQRYWIKFEGVDYAAKVWIDGTFIGSHVGYFAPFTFEVTHLLSVESKNHVVCVLVDAPLDPGFPNSKELFKGGLVHWDCRPGGWSKRGQERGSGGIWLPVQIIVTGSSKIAEKRTTLTFNQSDHELTNSSKISAYINFKVKLDDIRGQPVGFRVDLTPRNFQGDALSQWIANPREMPSKNRSGAHFREFEFSVQVENPSLWWTWELGKPNTYSCKLAVAENEEATTPSDVVEFLVGFRSIKLARDGWQLNGTPIFLRGTNYFSSLWMGEMDGEKFARDFDLLRKANMNFLRVSYHVEHPLFYDTCDLAGLLILQDFPTLWDYKITPDSRREALREMKDMVFLLHDHPCLAMMSCFTEPASAANKILAKAMQGVGQHYDLQGRKIYDSTSFLGHPFAGWYFGSEYCYLLGPAAPFPSEFGPQSLPNLGSPTWRDLDVRKNWPPNDTWVYHNFQPTINYKLARNLPALGFRGMVQHSQHYQAENLKFGIEAFRRLKGRIHALAIFTYCEAWTGGLGWSIVDNARLPKEAYHAVKSAYAPVMVSITPYRAAVPYKTIPAIVLDVGTLVFGLPAAFFWQDSFYPGGVISLDVWIANDLPKEHQGMLSVALYQRLENHLRNIDTKDVPLWKKSRETHVPPSSSHIALAISLKIPPKSPLRGQFSLVATFTDMKGTLIHENTQDIAITTRVGCLRARLHRVIATLRGFWVAVLHATDMLKAMRS